MGGATLGSVEGIMDGGLVKAGGGVLGCGAGWWGGVTFGRDEGGGWTVGGATLGEGTDVDEAGGDITLGSGVGGGWTVGGVTRTGL